MEPIEIAYLEIDHEADPGAQVLINGHRGFVERYNGNRETPAIVVNNGELRSLLEAYPVATLQNTFWSIVYREEGAPDSLFRMVGVDFWSRKFVEVSGAVGMSQSVRVEPPMFRFTLATAVIDWAYPWSPREHSEALRAATLKVAVDGLRFRPLQPMIAGFQFMCEARSGNHALGDEIAYWSQIIRSIHDEAIAHLVATQHADSLTTTFHFPAAIATACEQYLLYFVQFLADLGVEAQAEVKHEAAEVLFRVTPAQGREALERVREALDAYLSFPTAPDFPEESSRAPGIAVRQLRAQVSFLQSQVEIGKALLEAKNARIEALELSNFRLREIGGGTVPEEAQAHAVDAGEAEVQRLDAAPADSAEANLPAKRNMSILWTLDRLL